MNTFLLLLALTGLSVGCTGAKHHQLYEFAYGNELLVGTVVKDEDCGPTIKTRYDEIYYCVTTLKKTENPYAEQNDGNGY